jgi:hypothetical protein
MGIALHRSDFGVLVDMAEKRILSNLAKLFTERNQL